MSAYVDPSAMTWAEGARLLLMGAIAALLLRVAWGMVRSSEDRVVRIALVWSACVLVLLGARVALGRASLESGWIPWLVRLQDFAAMAPIPLLLRTLAPGARPRVQAVTRAFVVATGFAAAWVWLDGPVLGHRIVLRTYAGGASYATLATGPLLPLFGLIAAAAWAWAVRLVVGTAGRKPDGAPLLVVVGGGLLVIGGANDSLMDAGVLHSVPLIDGACFATLLLIGGTLSLRARAALGGAHARIEEQTRDLERHHAAVALRERQIALGALAAGLGHEINNPLTVVAVNLNRAVELLHELDRLAMVRASLVECQAACRDVARAVSDFGTMRPPAGDAVVPPSSAEPTARLRNLVVDDEPLVAKSLRRALRLHQVTVAHSGAEALELLREGRYDRVLCDVMMPGMSGPEVYRALEAEGRLAGVGFAFVTGGAFSSDVAVAVRSTGVPVLKKPVDPRELAAVVRGAGAPSGQARP